MAAKRVPYKGIKSLLNLSGKMNQLVKGKKPKGELGIKKGQQGELAQLKKKNSLYKKMSQY